MQKIISVEHLKSVANRDNGDFVQFYLLLAGGILRSGKRISYRPKEEKNWLIINEIDDTYLELPDEDLSGNTFIVEAINKGLLFLSDIP